MNHAAAGKRHAQELLETLYRELAILGIVAFILWAINVSPAVDIEVRKKEVPLLGIVVCSSCVRVFFFRLSAPACAVPFVVGKQHQTSGLFLFLPPA